MFDVHRTYKFIGKNEVISEEDSSSKPERREIVHSWTQRRASTTRSTSRPQEYLGILKNVVLKKQEYSRRCLVVFEQSMKRLPDFFQRICLKLICRNFCLMHFAKIYSNKLYSSNNKIINFERRETDNYVVRKLEWLAIWEI